MRRPVDSPYVITTEFGVPDSYAKFGRHSGVDYAVPAGRPVYAPTNGTLTNVVSPTGGNMVVIYDGKFFHRLMHNSSFSRANGAVVEGNEVAKAGTTGLSTGPHVHWDINSESQSPTSFAAFVPPADWLAGKYQSVTTGSSNVFNTIEEVKEAYLQMRGVLGTDAEMRGWIGQSKQRWIQVSKAETDSTRAQLANANKQIVTLTAQVAQLNTSVNQLKTQVASLTGQVKVLTDSITAKDKEIADLKAQVAAGGNGEDTDLLNKFGEILRKLIARLGLK